MDIISIIIGVLAIIAVIGFIITLVISVKNNSSQTEVNEEQSKLIKQQTKDVDDLKTSLKSIDTYKEEINKNIKSIEEQLSSNSDIIYLYDNDAIVYLGKFNSVKGFQGNFVSKCSAYGLYNKKTKRATITTNSFLYDSGNAESHVIVLAGIVINGITFKCLYTVDDDYEKNNVCFKNDNNRPINGGHITIMYPEIYKGSCAALGYVERNGFYNYGLAPTKFKVSFTNDNNEYKELPVYVISVDTGGGMWNSGKTKEFAFELVNVEMSVM